MAYGFRVVAPCHRLVTQWRNPANCARAARVENYISAAASLVFPAPLEAANTNMPAYVLRFLDRHSGKVVHCDGFPAEDELDAVRLAEVRRTLEPMELWTKSRCVKRWDAIFPLAWD